jgi:hypothetical protein
MLKFANSKAFKVLEKAYEDRKAAEAAAAAPVAPVVTTPDAPVHLVSESAKSSTFTDDPLKRVVEVTLSMTVEELQRFSAAVNATKRS